MNIISQWSFDKSNLRTKKNHLKKDNSLDVCINCWMNFSLKLDTDTYNIMSALSYYQLPFKSFTSDPVVIYFWSLDSN